MKQEGQTAEDMARLVILNGCCRYFKEFSRLVEININ
jgi:hypothetical protein